MTDTDNYAAAQKFTCLCVLSNEEQVHKLSKITQKMKSLNYANKVIKTTYEKFIEDKKQDTYNCVMLVMLESDLSADDLEMQQDHFDYYSTVPVVNIAISEATMASDEWSGIEAFLATNLKERIDGREPVQIKGDVEADATAMMAAIDDLKAAYEAKIESDVKPAFQKFDADGSGAIDKAELQKLSETLGFPLTDEQTTAALIDLDLNKDGVIDFSEFSRWYFTGMKSYNGKTRNMLRIGKKSKEILDKIKGQEIYDMIHQDKKVSTHRMSVSFNAPADVHYTETKVNLFGQDTANLVKDGQAFRDSLGAEYAPQIRDEEYADLFAELNVSMKSGNKDKYEAFVSKYQAKADGIIPKEENIYMKLSSTDDKLTMKLFIHQTKSNLQVPPIPDNLREALKDIDQHIKVKVVLGIDAEELLTSEKPILEQAMKGFSVNAEFAFLKNIKKAIQKEFEGSGNGKITDILGMTGPAFGFSSNTSLELEYEDFDEIKEHPMAGQLLMSMDQLTTGMLQKSVQEIREFKESMGDDFDQAKFDEFVKSDNGDYVRSKQEEISIFKDVLDFLGDINQTCDIQFKSHIDGIVSAQQSLHGAGYGDLCAFVFQMLTMEKRQSFTDRMLADFNESNQ